ncbi:DUF7620 family protein [Mycolicibacterium goodii]|uniref:DUF7620 family protein n=1 Tax=Mycolicibacterium goodii TaxID=134601 RepID=UPI001BDBD470|nr:hypothetical protein [Mycolicibacterium goodii]MBU8833583.1 hypothetical protein [Mycolicibacterium goodii]
MLWPWTRRRAEADAKLAEAEERSRVVEQLVNQARQVSAALRHEVDKNSWTEGLAASMQPRHFGGT